MQIAKLGECKVRHYKSVSIAVCVSFFILSTFAFVTLSYLSESAPNMNGALFVPASVKEVPEEQDVSVKLYPISVVSQSLREKCAGDYRLSDIKKGWMTNLYNGHCRLIFELKDSGLREFVQDDRHCYFYAEIVPRNRLNVYDVFALIGNHESVPFTSEGSHLYYPDSVEAAIKNYYTSRCVAICWIVLNTVSIVTVIIVNRHLVEKNKKS